MKDLDIKNTKNVVKNEKNERFFTGLTGEKIAVYELTKKGFSLIQSRYKTEYGEIDLIMVDDAKKILIFVEVKRRKEIYDYSSVISKKQWMRIYNSSSIFLAENQDKYKDYFVRYDAFICFTESKNTIHIENIFPEN